MLTIAICTKNRPHELDRCVTSLVQARRAGQCDEILIIDDGTIADDLVRRLRTRAIDSGFAFVYHRKKESNGLYSSRQITSQLASGQIVVFLDDDVEVAVDFLSCVSAHYDRDSALMGVGGVDHDHTGSLPSYLFACAFLIASSRPGRLSLTGMNGSFKRWSRETAPFDTEFMSGYCMSFRRAAIADLMPIPWMVGYSMGEDLLVSHQANKHGTLIIDPGLRFVHHQSPTNRWSEGVHIKHFMLGAIPRASILRSTMLARIAVYWSLLGLVVGQVLRLRGDRFVGALAGFVGSLRTSYPPLSTRRSEQVPGATRMARRTVKVAVVIDEYFGGARTAFGGFGFLARHVVARYVPGDGIDVEILLPRKSRFWRLLPTRRCIDGIDVITPPHKYWLPIWLWLKSFDVYLTIELTHDVTAYDLRPWKRIVHWIQDPRPWYVWRRIQTMTRLPEPCFFDPRLNGIVTEAQRKNQIRFISQGHSLDEYARDLYALPSDVPIEHLPNPVRTDEAFDQASCLKENLIIFLGRLESQKRGWLFCEVAKRMPQYEFMVLGKLHRFATNNAHMLEPYGGGRVPNLHFAGHLEGDAKTEVLKRAKILLNTSVWEGIPISFIEALAVGTLIVSNVNPDNLTARFGAYVGDVDGDGFDAIDRYVDAIEGLVRNEDKRCLLAQEAVAYVNAHHSIDAFQDRMRRLLREEALHAARTRKEVLSLGYTKRRVASVTQWIFEGVRRRLRGDVENAR